MLEEEEDQPFLPNEDPMPLRNNPTVEGQQRVGWVIVGQICVELMIAAFTIFPADDNRASFHYEVAEIATIVICTVLWIALYLFRKHRILSWVILVLWTIDFGMTAAFVSVTIQSTIPIFFLCICCLGSICLMVGLNLRLPQAWLPFVHSPFTIGAYVLLCIFDSNIKHIKWIGVPLVVLTFTVIAWVTHVVIRAKDNGYSISDFRDSLNHLYTAPIKHIVSAYKSPSSRL